jgi:hypothetical protein
MCKTFLLDLMLVCVDACGHSFSSGHTASGHTFKDSHPTWKASVGDDFTEWLRACFSKSVSWQNIYSI